MVNLAFIIRSHGIQKTTLKILHGYVYKPISNLSSYIVIEPKQDIDFTNTEYANIIDPAVVSSLTPITATVINNFSYNTLTKDKNYESNNYISGKINTEITSSLQTVKFTHLDAVEGYNLYCEHGIINNISAEIKNVSPDFFVINCEPEITENGISLRFPISVNGESDKSGSGIVSADLIIHNNINGNWIQISEPYTISAEYNFTNLSGSSPDYSKIGGLLFESVNDSMTVKLKYQETLRNEV